MMMSASPTSTEVAIAMGCELVPPELVASAKSYAKSNALSPVTPGRSTGISPMVARRGVRSAIGNRQP